MSWEFLELLGLQSSRPKHLKGKKNKKFPLVRGLFFFFAFEMLSLKLHDRLPSGTCLPMTLTACPVGHVP